MASTSAQAIISDEIAQQAQTVLEDALEVSPVLDALSEPLVLSEHPGPRSLLTHSGIRVTYRDSSREMADSESDFVAYSYEVLLWQSGDDQAVVGQALDAWAERLAETLGDSASDRSPLRTSPLPLTSVSVPNATVFSVSVDSSTPGVVQGSDDGAFRLARLLTVTVTVYRTRAR